MRLQYTTSPQGRLPPTGLSSHHDIPAGRSHPFRRSSLTMHRRPLATSPLHPFPAPHLRVQQSQVSPRGDQTAGVIRYGGVR